MLTWPCLPLSLTAHYLGRLFGGAKSSDQNRVIQDRGSPIYFKREV